jgi:N-carbamoylputrescine amidase
MSEKKVSIGLIQIKCSADPEKNLQHALAKIREAAKQNAQIVCLPELYRSLYFCDVENYDNFRLAESVPGPSTEAFSALAKELGIVIIVPLFEKRAHGLYHNTAAVIDADGTYLGKYRKMHIPDDPGFYEKFYFTPGDLGYKIFSTRYAKIGVLICWDQWYPEAARITALMGAEILFYPTAIGWASHQSGGTNQQQYQAWQMIQRSHALANGVFVAAANRTGMEGQMAFWGGSFVADPFGGLLCQASANEEDVIIQQIDLGLSDFYRTHWPFLRDRRIESYQPLTQRFLEDA